MEFGRKAYIDLVVSLDPVIRKLVEEGYEFVTNAFKPGANPPTVRVKHAESVALQLRGQGYLIELCTAYNEAGNMIPAMLSVWRKAQGARTA